MKKSILSILLLGNALCGMWAQSVQSADTCAQSVDAYPLTIESYAQYADSVFYSYQNTMDSICADFFVYFRLWDNLEVDPPLPRRVNADYYKLVLPSTFYTSVADRHFSIDWEPTLSAYTYQPDSLLLFAPTDSLQLFQPQAIGRSARIDEWISPHLMALYLNTPTTVKYNQLWYADKKAMDLNEHKVEPKVVEVKNFVDKVEDGKVESDNQLVVLKPNFWKKAGNGYVQFTQNKISDNWYKGGESVASLLSGLMLTANYDDHRYVEFENKLEMKVGFVTAPSDTVHSYKTNTDLVRFNSKLGVKAFKNFYYTLALEAKTQFFASYGTNSTTMISNFLSPAELDMTLGLDYKYSSKKITTSLLTSPLALTYVYVKDYERVNPTRFGVKEGEKSITMWGSKFTANFTWKIMPQVEWIAKFDYFTTYDKVIGSWENTFNFTVNKYLSAKLFLHGRFDDSVTLKEGQSSYFQFQEILSFGLNYNW